MTAQFPPSTPAGHGTVHLTSSPPQFKTLTYAYPLKLISPSPLTYSSRTIQTLFLLTYGGGLVAGDAIDLAVILDPETDLILLTQGSTKIFKTPNRSLVSSQGMSVRLEKNAALCYIPDPVQPFQDSAFEQTQIYNLHSPDASLCVCDWVTCGRAARGEKWNFWKYGSRNEVWDVSNAGKPRLLLRDNLILDQKTEQHSIAARVGHYGVFGTLILRGPLFEGLGEFLLGEFEALPRIGAKKWDGEEGENANDDSLQGRRLARQRIGDQDGLLWTAAKIRGFVVIKFTAREIEGVKTWLRAVLLDEGSIEARFGERALLCLK